MSFRTQLSCAGFGLAGVYAALGAFELVTGGESRNVLVFGIGALITAGLVAVLLPLLAPRGGGDSDEDGGGGGPGGSGGPPPPPWWPEFEREFWSHVEGPREGRGGPRPRDHTPA
ncbi:MAG TPA: hypothetical protein VGR10_01080 [Thermoleophilaceae bacterium]|nr:hypothetical protein [Thermoleophilaceae bacterium]